MDIVTDKNELERYIRKIIEIFDINELSGEHIEIGEIIEYYEKSELGYKFFHSPEGAIHMALNFDGEFNKDGYLEQVRIIDNLIKKSKPKDILELGSGKGFNSIYLAKENPQSLFTGIDLTPSHVSSAKEAGKNISNAQFQVGDFHKLNFKSMSFDLVFEIESVCHALDMGLALSEIHRVMREDGVFILFDGFRKPGFVNLDKNLQLASKLTEISMAVKKPFIVDDFILLAETKGFELVELKDLSTAIIPNLRKFQIMARGYFKYPFIAKLLLRVLSPYLIKNAVAGLLMPFIIMGDAEGYFQITLKRK